MESNVIEFPRTVEPTEELAEPIEIAPRIFEADVAPPVAAEEARPAEREVEAENTIAPAIASIVLEESEAESEEPPSAAKIEAPLPYASPSLRALAGIVDAAIVLTGTTSFAMLLQKMDSLPAGKAGLAVAAGMSVFLWTLYQYLFLVHRGMTAGMSVAGIRLASMQGTAARQSERRGRVLCMLLSLAPLGMGFAWAFFDDDGLCWHDRLSHTCMVLASFAE